MKGYPIDLSGKTFDRLNVLSKVESTKSGSIWLCQCVCGEYIKKLTSQLTRPKKNIGCKSCERIVRSDSTTVHGGCRLKRSRLHHIWKKMRGRCRNPNDSVAKYYFHKGIRVCDEWQSFETFRDWAAKSGYRDDLTIDRLDPNKNYEPQNCEWVTRAENSRRVYSPKGTRQ
jgi:hypothetical protein